MSFDQNDQYLSEIFTKYISYLFRFVFMTSVTAMCNSDYGSAAKLVRYRQTKGFNLEVLRQIGVIKCHFLHAFISPLDRDNTFCDLTVCQFMLTKPARLPRFDFTDRSVIKTKFIAKACRVTDHS